MSLVYKVFVLLVLFGGGYLLLRYGMNLSGRMALIVSGAVMPVAAFLLWLSAYRGKKFK